MLNQNLDNRSASVSPARRPDPGATLWGEIMAYERKTIDISKIHEQEDICKKIFDRVTRDGLRPLAMVDTYGCQQNEADSEKLRGYLSEMGYSFTQDEFQADVIVVNT